MFVQVVFQKGIFINNIYLNIKIKSVNVFYSFYLPVHAINYSVSISAFGYQKDTGRSETYPTILSKKHLNFGIELPKISHPVSLLNIYSCCYNISLKKKKKVFLSGDSNWKKSAIALFLHWQPTKHKTNISNRSAK